MKVIAVANQKGGVGKSTTCIQLARGLTEFGKVLLIDTEAQCSITSVMIPDRMPEKTILNVMSGECVAAGAITHTTIQDVDIIPGSPFFNNDSIKNTNNLRKFINELKLFTRYDYLIIDSPPTLDRTLTAVLIAADYVLIPTVCSKDAINSFYQFMPTIEGIKTKSINSNLKALGILPTMYRAQTTLHTEVLAELKRLAAERNIRVFSPIRHSVKVAEAAAFNMSVFDYAPTAAITSDYSNLVADVIDEIRKDKAT